MRAGPIKVAARPLLKPRPHRSGFTLLELIVVLIIISLMSALIVPRLTGPKSNLDLKTTAKNISTFLRYARSRAVAEKTIYVALFDFDNNRLAIFNPSLAIGDLVINNKEAIEKILQEQLCQPEDAPGAIKTYQPGDGIRLARGSSRAGDVDAGLFPVFFFPGGGCSGAEITVADQQGRHYKITVDFITGTVKLSEVIVS